MEFNFINDDLTMATPSVRLGQLDIVACLLRAGMDPAIRDFQGHTAQHRAMHLDHPFLEAAILLGMPKFMIARCPLVLPRSGGREQHTHTQHVLVWEEGGGLCLVLPRSGGREQHTHNITTCTHNMHSGGGGGGELCFVLRFC